GFELIALTVTIDGTTILNQPFADISAAESFFTDNAIHRGAYSGLVDLTLGYSLTANGAGGFGFDFAIGGAVPELSTWAMLLIGFGALSFVAVRRGLTVPLSREIEP
ncbi:MAG TPA: hypothetical protein VKG91_09050, partial [Roseiarcus sp.]|nr:hypothetical protein [Roseiarcus sp.]